MYEDDEIPISLVCQWVYCPRRAWLEAAGEHTDTYQMQAGIDDHINVDDASTAAPDEIRALEVGSSELGIIGKLDCLRETPGGVVIIEYKATPVKRAPEVTEAMRLQLALQSLCLREMGQNVCGTEVFFTSHRKHVEVDLSEDDYQAAKHAVQETRRVIEGDDAPLPPEDDARCSSCSHETVCLPEERQLAPIAHAIKVSDPDSQIVHLTTPGAYAKLRQGQMIITKGDETLAKIPLETVQGVEVHGNVNLTGGLIQELLRRQMTIIWCSGSGWVHGWAVSSFGPNGEQRVKQYVASREGRLDLAREFIVAKICNQATQLRRGKVDASVIDSMRDMQKKCSSASCIQEVLGYEGDAASIYFRNFPMLIRESEREKWSWSGRSGRPAYDSMNAMLNYVYGLLLADVVRAITSCGLDPHAGFLHSSGRNKPALALDLMEEFRAPVGDSVVQTAINNGEVKPEGFEEVLGVCTMKENARKALVVAYERRMETEFKHPVFGYNVSWRRAMEIQARQVLGVLDGSQPEYKGIRVR